MVCLSGKQLPHTHNAMSLSKIAEPQGQCFYVQVKKRTPSNLVAVNLPKEHFWTL